MGHLDKILLTRVCGLFLSVLGSFTLIRFGTTALRDALKHFLVYRTTTELVFFFFIYHRGIQEGTFAAFNQKGYCYLANIVEEKNTTKSICDQNIPHPAAYMWSVIANIFETIQRHVQRSVVNKEWVWQVWMQHL